MHDQTLTLPIHEHLKLHASQYKQKIQHPSHPLHKHTTYFNTPRLKTLFSRQVNTQQIYHRLSHNYYNRHPTSLILPLPKSGQTILPSFIFADDCLIYRNIKNKEDLNFLENWGNTWGMRFNAAKCNIMRVSRTRDPKLFNYSLTGQVLGGSHRH